MYCVHIIYVEKICEGNRNAMGLELEDNDKEVLEARRETSMALQNYDRFIVKINTTSSSTLDTYAAGPKILYKSRQPCAGRLLNGPFC